MVVINPAHPESKEIVEQIQAITVTYINDDGSESEGVIEVHASVEDEVRRFFTAAYDLKFPIHKIVVSSEYDWDDDRLMAANSTSGFNYRLIKGTRYPSLHGLGVAFDINPATNPYVRFVDGETLVDPPGAVYDPEAPGALTATHPLVTLMKNLGWEWGGDWTIESGRIDYQHFEKPLLES